MSLKGIVRTLVLFVLIIFLLLHSALYLGRDLAVQWLLDQGAEQAEIERLSVNWFNGQISLSGLTIMTPGQPTERLQRLLIDLDYSELMNQRILISQILIHGADIDIRQQQEGEHSSLFLGPVEIPLTPADNEQPEPESEPSPWLFGLDQLVISDFRWQTRLPDQSHQLEIEHGELSSFYMWRKQEFTQVSLKGAINGAHFDLDSQAQPLPDTKRSELKLKLDRLPVHSITGPFVPQLKATLSTDLTITAELTGDNATVTQKGLVSIDGAQWQDSALSLQQKNLTWQGQVVATVSKGQPTDVKVTGSVTGLASDVMIPDRAQLLLSEMGWKGAVQVDLTSDTPAISMQSDRSSLTGLKSVILQKNYSLLSLDSLIAEQISLAPGGEVNVAKVTAKAAVIGQQQSTALDRLGQLSISKLSFQPGKQLEIGQIDLLDNTVMESLSADGKPVRTEQLLAAIDTLTASESTDAETDSASDAGANTASEQAALRIKIGRITVAGDSRVLFEDQGTSPVFSTEVALKRLELKQLDTASQAMSPFNVKIGLNQFTTLDLEGETNLAGGGDSATWVGNLQQLEMPRLSPYSIRYTGYYLNSGQMHLETSGELKQGQIEGKNHIQLNRLEVEVADQEQMGKFSKQLSMPLGTAISILQDSDDNIDLDIPVTGSLDDPDFGLQSVMKRLAGKGLKQAALSFLTKSLEPYATLISLASSAVEGSFVTLEPVSFAPGSAVLNGQSSDYLSKISAMMSDRKGIRLNICGQAVQQDQLILNAQLQEENKARKKPLPPEALAKALNEKLIALAQQRSDLVKKTLSATVAGERLFNCFPVPKLDDAAAVPVATLGL